MRQGAIVICWLIAAVFCTDCTTSKWWHDENDQHECLSCQAMTCISFQNAVHARHSRLIASHCPSEGYICQEGQPLRALVLTDYCHCQSLACANRDWRLAVNGSIVDRIRCERREWYTSYGESVPSAVCIKMNPDKSTSTSTVPTTSTTTKPTTVTCPALTMLSLADCVTAIGGQRKTCAEAIFSETSVTCEDGDAMFIFRTSDIGYESLQAPLMCAGTIWKFVDGSTLSGNLLTSPIGCLSPQTTTTSTTTEPSTTTSTEPSTGNVGIKHFLAPTSWNQA
ncbi:hypothetical protein PRIPAC_96169 [Pristionchus pacificus]|uniref:Uncharacterized protein n=1 Tax=Pristionchus pacificus TaxID=54126 RepID=A0A2A6B398_PRIPA|nr:hypothetical protein PRIPAC_96169 [Pristionchus pacificus]|eukprot:PDM60338.1 hypothetical protein PRIPAC_54163 [Pristionchus pacificus]